MTNIAVKLYLVLLQILAELAAVIDTSFIRIQYLAFLLIAGRNQIYVFTIAIN